MTGENNGLRLAAGCMTARGLCLLLGIAAVTGAMLDAVAAEPVLLKANGGWCWFQGERAVVVRERLVFTTIAGDDGSGWDAGDLVATLHDFKSGKTSHFELHDRFHRDDHDAAGLLVLPDERVLAVYGKHGNDRLQRWRITARPADISEWSAGQSLDIGTGYTYSNVFRLAAENGRIYNFHRGLGFNPNCNISEDGGKTWRYGWRLLERTKEDYQNDPRHTGMDGRRPYLRYASDGSGSIHFIITDDHPRAYDNSLYHGCYRDGKLLRSDGAAAGLPGFDGSSPLKPRSFTEVFRGDADHVAWAADLRLDADGRPFAAFSVQRDGAASRAERKAAGGGQDHRYHYARWDGSRWHVHEMAHAGTRLYAGEDDYTGLVALDPHDPHTVFISTNADPQSGQPLMSAADGKRHWELFQGTTQDGGASWSWQAVTANSACDHLRPVIPVWPGGPRVVLWARGELRSYTDYRLDVVMLRQERR